jgi:hypothetical protein
MEIEKNFLFKIRPRIAVFFNYIKFIKLRFKYRLKFMGFNALKMPAILAGFFVI